MSEPEAEPSPLGPVRRRDWAVLYRYPLLVDQQQLPRRADFKVDLEAPPRSSVVRLTRALLHDPANPSSLAFLNCVDETGHLLLVSATQGAGTERLIVCHAGSRKACALPAVPASLNIRISVGDTSGIVADAGAGSAEGEGYIVAQLHPAAAPSAPSTSLGLLAAAAASPIPPEPAAAPSTSLGPLAAAAASPMSPGPAAAPSTSLGPLAAAAPSPISSKSAAAPPTSPGPSAAPAPPPGQADAPATATTSGPPVTVHLLCFASRSKTWRLKDISVFCPSEGLVSHFHVDTVVAHLGRLVFVDFARGIISCDPRLEHQHARLVPFPEGAMGSDEAGGHQGIIHSRRCVSVSEDRLRLVCITGVGHAAMLSMWSCLDSEADWAQDYTNIPLCQIWNNPSYQEEGLPQGIIPSIGVIDPTDSGVVCFFSGSKLFSVRLTTCDTMACDLFFLDMGSAYSSHDTISWVLPTITKPPHAQASSGYGILKTLKGSGKALRKYVKSATRYLQVTKEHIEQVPGGAEGLELLFGALWSQASAATRLIAQLSNNALKAVNSLDSDRIEKFIVGDLEEADRAILIWNEMEQRKVPFVEFPYHLDQAVKDNLNQYFTTKGAECIVLNPDKWIEEEPYHMV